MTTEAVIDVVDSLVKRKQEGREKLSNLSRDELLNIIDVLRDAEIELQDRDITDDELTMRFAMMEHTEINSGRF
tara:strand:+ start:3339 stop:3560 length:222 start_codon:yes stop_codon:yes gene_type:complete